MAAPRIVHLLHGSFETDPRVRRHAGAAIDAGYRVSVLLTGGYGCSTDRIGFRDGVEVRVIGSNKQTIAGKARRRLTILLRALRGTNAGRSIPVARSGITGDRSSTPGAVLNANSWRDVLALAMLVRQNIEVFRHGRNLGGRVVHANDLNTLLAGVLLARAWSAPLVYDSHELWVDTNDKWSPLYRAFLAAFERLLVHHADAVVTVNGAVARELAKRYRLSMPTVVMNCPPLEPRRIERDAQPGALLRVVYLGMLNEGRGLRDLIDAARSTRGICLTIYGHGPLAAEITAAAIDGCETENVRIEAAVPVASVVDVLRSHDVGVIPYPATSLNTRMSSPVKLFEYMAAGLAIVASDLPVIREIVESTGCGLLTIPADSGDIAAKLRILAADRALTRRLGDAAYHAAATRYNAETEHATLLNVYQAVGLPDAARMENI